MPRSIWLLAALALAGCGGNDGDGTGGSAGSASTAPTTSEAGGGSGGFGGSGGHEAGGGGASPAEPITAPADAWTWVDFPGSKCAAGTPTGIGVNLHPGAKDVLVYFEGGGGCTNAMTCWGPSPSATNLTGFDADTFATAKQRAYPILRRLADNPFGELNMVYVPYCTGDLHAGTAEVDMQVDGATKRTYFWGGKDLDLFLARLVPTFPHVGHVWSAGTSAGGFATFLTFDKLARAFGVRVDILDDSGPPFAPKGATDNEAAVKVWGFEPPKGCSPCSRFSDYLAFDRKSQPKSKFGFLSFAEDPTISAFLGYSVAEYPALIDDFRSSLASDPGAATYVVTNRQAHVVESDPTLVPDYLPWISQMATDDAGWKDVTFPHP